MDKDWVAYLQFSCANTVRDTIFIQSNTVNGQRALLQLYKFYFYHKSSTTGRSTLRTWTFYWWFQSVQYHLFLKKHARHIAIAVVAYRCICEKRCRIGLFLLPWPVCEHLIGIICRTHQIVRRFGRLFPCLQCNRRMQVCISAVALFRSQTLQSLETCEICDWHLLDDIFVRIEHECNGRFCNSVSMQTTK